jgi:cleavage and polyadenylation specificity factor subunit 3
MIAGYAVEGTLAKEIMAQPKEVVTLEGRRQPLNALVDYVSFSAHVDFVQNRSFITQVAPKHIILVHGQKDEMGRLKSALMLQYKQYPEVSGVVATDVSCSFVFVPCSHWCV